MHEQLNSYADFLAQPHVKESGLIQWLAQAGFNRPVPVPAMPGMLPQLDGTPRGTAPVTGQHTAEILQQHGYGQAEIELADGQGHRRRGMITPARSGRLSPHAVEERRRRHHRHRRARGRLALRPHADHHARSLLRLFRLRPRAGAGRRPRPGAADARRRDRRAHAFKPVAFAGETPIVSRLEAGAVEVVNLIGNRAGVRDRPAGAARRRRDRPQRRHAPRLCRRRAGGAADRWRGASARGGSCLAPRCRQPDHDRLHRKACFWWGASYAYSGDWEPAVSAAALVRRWRRRAPT